MAKPNFQQRGEIAAQIGREIQFAREYKAGKTANWKINEDLYYGRKQNTQETSRANIQLGRMQEFVHTLLSKIDAPLLFKFVKRKNSQHRRVERLNALRAVDQNRDWWDIKDIAGKKQGVVYGRAIYSYYADSMDGYRVHLDNVDVYDFLIDPSAGGIDIERARFLGDYGVILSRKDLENGIRDGFYLRTETNRLLEGSGNSTEQPQEVQNQKNRSQAVNTQTQKEIGDPDKYTFWRWGTTYKGQRYYCLYSERSGTLISAQPLEEVFKSGMWWYWTYAVFLDLTEFWSPSYCDYVREIFMAQDVSVNQAFDNSEEINKPQKVVDTGAIKNLAELKYQRGGNYIKAKPGTDTTRAIQLLRPSAIDTPIKMFELLETIQEKASGVTAAAKGTAGEEKVGIYEGNQANTADRFGLLNKSYAFGYKRFAEMYEAGVREHLLKKTAVDIMGPDGVEIIDVSRRDIFRKDDKFGIIVEASDAELSLSETDKRTKLAFLSSQVQNPLMNQKKAFEVEATIAGFDEETIRQLMDSEDFGSAGVMSEADRDIERILDGETFKPNAVANTAYKQRFVDYMRNNEENITPEQFTDLVAYIESLEPIIMNNMAHRANEIGAQQVVAQAMAPVTEPVQTQAPQPLDITQ